MPFPSSIEKFEGLITIWAFVKLIDIKSWNIKWKIKLSKYLLPPLSLRFMNVGQPGIVGCFYAF